MFGRTYITGVVRQLLHLAFSALSARPCFHVSKGQGTVRARSTFHLSRSAGLQHCATRAVLMLSEPLKIVEGAEAAMGR